MSITHDDVCQLIQKWKSGNEGWKGFIIELSNMANDDPENKVFSQNAEEGISYLLGTIFGTLCKKCKDEKSWNWLKAYTDAFVNGHPLPEFNMGCLEDNCED